MRTTALRTYRELLQAAWVREVPVGPVDETLARVGRILREAKIPFAVVGGFAVIEYGYERFTKDVDVLVYAADPENGVDVDLLGTAFDVEETALARAARTRTALPVISVAHLILMKLESGRSQDDADIVELLKAGAPAASVARYLRRAWPKLLPRFRELAAQARAEQIGRAHV